MPLRSLWLLTVLGLALGLLFVACDNSTVVPRCLRSNCSGCCDDNGDCQPGSNVAACGSQALICQVCAPGQDCLEGECITRGTGGGLGGNMGGGPGGGAGGGGIITLPDGGPLCGPSNCQGCCENNTCHGGNIHSACGKMGVACSACALTQACVIGQCDSPPCQGCKDQSGTCQTGNTTAACGSAGNACAQCTGGTQVCNGFSCVATPSCSSANCPGCCQNNTCVTQQNDFTCGVNGAACVGCLPGDACQLGICAPPYDAGSGPCGSWNCEGCCEPDGTCRGGNAILACGKRGEACQVCLICIDRLCVL
ncbi:MAG: hypothetical protein K1X64_18135 [Myxococcaceae bacterium]|nr:hypothetical protein [Myxococcaceae bacterium]